MTPLLKQIESSDPDGRLDLRLIRASVGENDAGDGEAVFFAGGTLLLRFLRDRGQDFVDIAARASPERFFQFGDVEIALGWKSAEQVINVAEPEALVSVIQRLTGRLEELEKAFSPPECNRTLDLAERAARDRSEAFVKSLQ